MTKTTYRNAKKEKFTPISNTLLWDKEASLQAKGLLSIFLSNSNDWELNMKEIITRSKNGRDAHYKIVNELIELGYFARVQVVEPTKRQFEEMIYIFSDIKQEVAEEIESVKKWAAENKKNLVIEYKIKKEKKTKDNEKEPVPDFQETEENPIPENQDAEKKKPANQYINNTNEKNTNENNTNKNLNPNLSDIYNVLWNTEIPHDLKVKIKIMIDRNKISLLPEDILLIQDAYHYQIQKGYVIPNCSMNDIDGLNDFEFSRTVAKMLETVQDIKNIKGLIKEWVEQGYSYKKDQLHASDYSSTTSVPGYERKVPFYNWLED